MGVELRDIACQFDRVPAVRGISLGVADGEFLALVGPSGAGKTTLLRIIAGLQPGYTGQVTIGTRDVTRVPARHRNIGFVFQNYALFGHLSVAENVAFGLKVRPFSRRPGRAAIAARVAELLELVQVGPLAKRHPAQLSGGQRQRVALARALATEPDVLLLDEPFGALDPLVRKEIRTWLRSLHDRLGLTSILVTHDQEEALEVADRIAVLREGRLEQIDTPDMLEHAPATPFVHRFLGETVVIEAVSENGRLRAAEPWSGPGMLLPSCPPSSGPVRISIRPYAIGLRPIDIGAPGAVVLGVRASGAFLRYRVAPDGAGEAAAIQVLVPASLPALAPGSRCLLDLSAARVFPMGDGGAAPLAAEAA